MKYVTRAQIALQAAKRPEGYVAELMRCAVSEDDGGVTFDTSRPEWEALRQKYRKRYGIGDGIKALTGAVEIEECGGCKKRRDALNALTAHPPRTQTSAPQSSAPTDHPQ